MLDAGDFKTKMIMIVKRKDNINFVIEAINKLIMNICYKCASPNNYTKNAVPCLFETVSGELKSS